MSKVTNKSVNNKKSKRVKGQKDCKPLEERAQIVKETLDKLLEVNLAAYDDDGKVYSSFDGVQELIKVLEEYKKPGLLSGFSGIIKVPELKRNIEYILPLRMTVAHGVRLVSDETKDYSI